MFQNSENETLILSQTFRSASSKNGWWKTAKKGQRGQKEKGEGEKEKGGTRWDHARRRRRRWRGNICDDDVDDEVIFVMTMLMTR